MWHLCRNRVLIFCSFTWLLRRALCAYQTRIVGGYVERSQDVIQWQVLILRNGKVHCGGTLLKHNKVLTAAHCDVNESLTTHKLVIGHAKFKQAKRYNIVHVYVHPKYHHGKRGEPINDVAVLEFDNKDRNISRSYPILNRNHSIPIDKQQALVSGFGQTQTNLDTTSTSDVLRTTSLRIVSNLTCAGYYGLHMKHRICASGGSRTDSCLGDSGGALYTVNNNDENDTRRSRKFLILGIVSFGIGCADLRSPGIYARVSDYISWIDDVLSLKDTPISPLRMRIIIAILIVAAILLFLIAAILLIYVMVRNLRKPSENPKQHTPCTDICFNPHNHSQFDPKSTKNIPTQAQSIDPDATTINSQDEL